MNPPSSPAARSFAARSLETVSRTGAAVLAATALLLAPSAGGDEPSVSYIFPAGGQRGTSVDFHVGGHYLHDACRFHLDGPGIEAPKQLARGDRNLWFEGPRIPLPDSQKKEDYPWPQEGWLRIAPDAGLGMAWWRVGTAQGVTAPMPLVVGDLPEVVEREIDGDPVPVEVQCPVTINGRIFPREDVDIWTVSCRAGASYSCEVVSARLGSPLDARLAVHGPDGQLIAESFEGLGPDPRLQFTAELDGLHQVRIHDTDFGGLQHYVYRLTITDGQHLTGAYPLGGRRGESTEFQLQGQGLTGKTRRMELPPQGERFQLAIDGAAGLPLNLELSDAPELLEPEAGNDKPSGEPFEAPATLNGRIREPGEVDRWSFSAAKGQAWQFAVHAARLGSPLDSVLEIWTAEGEMLVSNDDADPSGDAELRWTAPADGSYTLAIREAFAPLAGDHYSYRIHVALPAEGAGESDFQLTTASPVINLPLDGEVAVEVQIAARSAFASPLRLSAEGLPEGVTCDPVEVKGKPKKAKLTLRAASDAHLGEATIRIVGQLMGEDGPGPRQAARTSTSGREGEDLTLATVLATPFKFTGVFQTNYAPAGGQFLRRYAIERNGYEGPLRARLAERQVRHLQGVTGPEIEIPPGQDFFEYPVRLAPWMEVGRTSRTCIMLVGEVEGPDGRRHTVSYSSQAQNDQIILLVDPPPLAVRPLRRSVLARAGQAVQVPVQVSRGVGVEGPVRVELIAPPHLSSIRCEPVVLEADADQALLRLEFPERLGPLNMAVTIRATTLDEPSLVAEAELDL